MIAIFPELAAAAAAGDAERLAILVRQYFGGAETHAPKPCVMRMAREAGIAVERLATDGHGALLAKDEKGRFTIVAVVPPTADEATARFVTAHQLGHYFLDVQPLIARGDWQVSGYREVVCPLKRYGGQVEAAPSKLPAQQRELKADAFAAALLLPRGMVRRAVERLRDPDRVAAFFGVTRACLARRMADLGMAERTPVSFLDAERLAGRAGGESAPPPELVAASDANLRAPAGAARGAKAPVTAPYAGGAKPAAERAPERAAPVQRPASTPAPAEAPAASGGGIGMERLREIARKLDKGMSK
jgi:hypothetical protein